MTGQVATNNKMKINWWLLVSYVLFCIAFCIITMVIGILAIEPTLSEMDYDFGSVIFTGDILLTQIVAGLIGSFLYFQDVKDFPTICTGNFVSGILLVLGALLMFGIDSPMNITEFVGVGSLYLAILCGGFLAGCWTVPVLLLHFIYTKDERKAKKTKSAALNLKYKEAQAKPNNPNIEVKSEKTPMINNKSDNEKPVQNVDISKTEMPETKKCNEKKESTSPKRLFIGYICKYVLLNFVIFLVFTGLTEALYLLWLYATSNYYMGDAEIVTGFMLAAYIAQFLSLIICNKIYFKNNDDFKKVCIGNVILGLPTFISIVFVIVEQSFADFISFMGIIIVYYLLVMLPTLIFKQINKRKFADAIK